MGCGPHRHDGLKKSVDFKLNTSHLIIASPFLWRWEAYYYILWPLRKETQITWCIACFDSNFNCCFYNEGKKYDNGLNCQSSQNHDKVTC